MKRSTIIRYSWGDGFLFGVGFTIAVIGLASLVAGPIPDDWTIIPTGAVIMAVAGWQHLRLRARETLKA